MKWATPFGANVIVKLVEIPGSDQTAGGLFVAQRDTSQEPKQVGEVVAVGPAVKSVTVGEHVLFSKFEGIETPAVSEDEFLCLGEHLLLMKIDLAEIIRVRQEIHNARVAAHQASEAAAAERLAAERSSLIQARG
jgi:co-chaperonin GroES (HSP10)